MMAQAALRQEIPTIDIDLNLAPEEQEEQIRKGLAGLPHITGNERTDKFQKREDLRQLAAMLCKRYPGRLGNVFPTQIAFLVNLEDKPISKGRAALAKTFRMSARYEFLTGYTHVIEFYSQHTTYLTNNQLTVLLYHELLHIGEEGKLQGHDVEEFGEIVDAFGRTVLDYQREDIPDILDEAFEWKLSKPTLFDASEVQA